MKTVVVSPMVLKPLQTSGSHEAYAAGDFTDNSWMKACFGKDMPIFNCRQFHAVWNDGAHFKHGNLYQGIDADPMRDVVGVYYSTCPVTGDADLLPGYILQAAKTLAGK